MSATIPQIYATLLEQHGAQHWWPGGGKFEVMVGAVLTQNTSWHNVEKAIVNLKHNDALSAETILATPTDDLANWLRPSGYFNVKSKRLKALCTWYCDMGQLATTDAMDTESLRASLLDVHGIGPETADDILLYAYERPVFVIDAYTRRLFSRLGVIDGDESYEDLRAMFEASLEDSDDAVALFNEYHALIVLHAKEICRKHPVCSQCSLNPLCSSSLKAGR